MPTEELWKPIEGTVGMYQVSSLGKVYSKKTKRLLKPSLLTGGYPRVHLKVKDVIDTDRYVHQLVAKAFVLNPYNFKVVHHIDGNKENNEYTNLEWCTQKDNIHHAIKAGTFTQIDKLRQAKKSPRQATYEEREYIMKQASLGVSKVDLAKEFDCSWQKINNIVKNGHPMRSHHKQRTLVDAQVRRIRREVQHRRISDVAKEMKIPYNVAYRVAKIETYRDVK